MERGGRNDAVDMLKMVGMGNLGAIRREPGSQRYSPCTFFGVVFFGVGAIKTLFGRGREREKHSGCWLETSKTGKQSQDWCLWQGSPGHKEGSCPASLWLRRLVVWEWEGGYGGKPPIYFVGICYMFRAHQKAASIISTLYSFPQGWSKDKLSVRPYHVSQLLWVSVSPL